MGHPTHSPLESHGYKDGERNGARWTLTGQNEERAKENRSVDTRGLAKPSNLPYENHGLTRRVTFPAKETGYDREYCLKSETVYLVFNGLRVLIAQLGIILITWSQVMRELLGLALLAGQVMHAEYNVPWR
jgi:hypothetical protein